MFEASNSVSSMSLATFEQVNVSLPSSVRLWGAGRGGWAKKGKAKARRRRALPPPPPLRHFEVQDLIINLKHTYIGHIYVIYINFGIQWHHTLRLFLRQTRGEDTK
jgi:hypothetical protein